MQAAIEVSNEREKSRLQQAGANAEIHKMGVMTAEQFNNPNAMASHEAQVQKLFTLVRWPSVKLASRWNVLTALDYLRSRPTTRSCKRSS